MAEKSLYRVDLTTEVLVKAGRLMAQLEAMTDLEDKILFLAAELQDYGEATRNHALAEVGVEPPVDGFVAGMRTVGDRICPTCGFRYEVDESCPRDMTACPD